MPQYLQGALNRMAGDESAGRVPGLEETAELGAEHPNEATG